MQTEEYNVQSIRIVEVMMVRFILNFIFFGVLFYAISLFFPDAFQTLVSWAGKVYTFIVDIVVAVIDWVSEFTKPGSANGSGG